MTWTACVSGRAGAGWVTAEPSEVVTAAVVAQRLGWLADIVRSAAQAVVNTHWNAGDVALLGSGVGPDGRSLPSSAWMAGRRLGWQATTVGVHASDRVRRCADEQAMRTLRGTVFAEQVIAALVSTWPAEAAKRTPHEWAALWAALPAGVDKATVRNRTRQIVAFDDTYGRLPLSVCELETAPVVSRMVVLAAADKQMVCRERVAVSTVVYDILAPTAPGPTRADWSWLSVPITLGNVPSDAEVLAPTIRFDSAGRVLVDVPWTKPVPAQQRAGHRVGVGADWGVNTTITACVAALDPSTGAVVSRSERHRFAAHGVHAKLDRLRVEAQQLAAKLTHYNTLGAADQAHHLHRKANLLRTELCHVNARRRNLADAEATQAARWTVDLALTAGATVIYIEDLGTLEAVTRGGPAHSRRRAATARISQRARGRLTAMLVHLAAEHGIAVVTVAAHDTSKLCSSCQHPLNHVKSPDRTDTPGWSWAHCPNCLLSADRDTVAARNIVARGLANQANTRATSKTNPTLRITRYQPAISTVGKRTPTRSSQPPVPPRRHRTPTTTQPQLRRQRPVGHQPGIVSTRSRPQLMTTQPARETTRQPHRPDGAHRGHGFHRNAHATRLPATPTRTDC